MASNEHAYLSEANLHNPKGLSLANNNTVCCKDNSGLLSWEASSFLKTQTAVFSGYCSLATNYQYPSNYNNNNKSPHQINKDYGSSVISSSTTVTQSLFFNIPSFVASGDGVINEGLVQVSSTDSDSLTIALVKYTFSSSATTAYPVVLSEKIVAGLSDNNLVNSYPYNIPLDFANTAITGGDRLFIMIKSATSSATVYATVSVEVGYTGGLSV